MRQMKSLNENQIRKNHMNYLQTDDVRNSNKNKFHDVVSVIQDADDSFVSQSELEEFGRQLGLQTVVVNQDSFDYNKGKHQPKHFIIDGLSKKHSDTDTILDFSNMMKIKQRGQRTSQTQIKTLNFMKKFDHFCKCFYDIKQAVIEDSNQVKKKLFQLKQACVKIAMDCFNGVLQQVKTIRKVDLQEKQYFKKQNSKLKQTIQQLVLQNNRLKQQKNNSHQQQNSKDLRKSSEATEIQKQLSLIKERFRMSDLQILSLNKKNTNASELSTQFQKQSQLVKNQNTEIQQLHKQIQQLNNQNKQLKRNILQYEKKLRQKEQQLSRKSYDADGGKIQMYTTFLEKIESLQKQIQDMRGTNRNKKDEKYQEQIQIQLAQIDQYLLNCEHREQQLQTRERQIVKKQIQIQRRYNQLAQYEEQAQQYQQAVREQQYIENQNKISKRVPTSPTRKSLTITRNPFYSEKNIKMNISPKTPRKKTETYSRASLGFYHKQLERQPSFQNQPRYSDQINCRLMKIESSIANQLNALGYRS